MAMATSEPSVSSPSQPRNPDDYCKCCHQFCTDADRAAFTNRFSTFKARREAEWAALSPTPPLPLGKFPFTRLPRELRNAVYNDLLESKTGVERYVTHDHTFPAQILYLNKRIRDEFLDALFDSVYVMCQYSMNSKHIELRIPPATLFHRVNALWARFVVTDTHDYVVPSWDQVLHDISLLLGMFPNLAYSHLVLKGVFKDTKIMDEFDIMETWDKCALKESKAIVSVKFEFEGLSMVAGGAVTTQREDNYDLTRHEGTEWRIRKMGKPLPRV